MPTDMSFDTILQGEGPVYKGYEEEETGLLNLKGKLHLWDLAQEAAGMTGFSVKILRK